MNIKIIQEKIIDTTSLLINILFPFHCPGCQSAIDAPCCKKCFRQISFKPSLHQDNRLSVFDYNCPIVKKMIWRIKWENGYGEALMLVKKAEKFIITLPKIKDQEKIILIPLPQSKERRKKRGYNQTELISQAFCEIAPDDYEVKNNILKKKDNIKPQTVMENKKKRKKNISEAFYLNKSEEINNRNIIIIDDVTTTGASLREALKEVNKARPKLALALALAG